jgi:hypothetical protein
MATVPIVAFNVLRRRQVHPSFMRLSLKRNRASAMEDLNHISAGRLPENTHRSLWMSRCRRGSDLDAPRREHTSRHTMAAMDSIGRPAPAFFLFKVSEFSNCNDRRSLRRILHVHGQ